MTIDSLPQEVKPLSEALEGKVIVADTSSLLMAGTALLTILEDCTLVIPAIVVSELESKRSHSTLGFLAREWLRLLEEIRVEDGIKLREGVQIDYERGISIRVEPNHSAQQVLPKHLQNGSNDSTILAVAKNLAQDETIEEDVVILSNDMPMRIHATLDIAIPAYEFNATQIVGAKPFDGRYTVDLDGEEYAASNAAQYGEKDALDIITRLVLEKLPEDASYAAEVKVTVDGVKLNDYIVFGNKLKPLARKNKAKKITARTEEQDVALTYLKVPASELPIVSLGGGAGTGKTLLTIAAALDELEAHRYQKVIVFRSLHEMGNGQEMGFLPGGVNEKMEAWAGAVFDAIDVLAEKDKPTRKNAPKNVENTAQKTAAQRLRDMVEIAPITYLRGRSLANTFIVLEEAQNFSRSEILNILSRAGENSKIVLTFDAAQVDNRFLQAGKNADIWSVIDSLKHSELFAHITLKKTERSAVAELASKILEG